MIFGAKKMEDEALIVFSDCYFSPLRSHIVVVIISLYLLRQGYYQSFYRGIRKKNSHYRKQRTTIFRWNTKTRCTYTHFWKMLRTYFLLWTYENQNFYGRFFRKMFQKYMKKSMKIYLNHFFWKAQIYLKTKQQKFHWSNA